MQRHGGSRSGICHTDTCANYHIQGVERVVAGSGGSAEANHHLVADA